MMNEPSVAYVCDRNACCPSVRENGCGECTHTQNIEHAINFTEIFPGMYVEIDNQGCPPAFDANLCESCVHSDSIAGDAECYNCCGYYANNYKAKSTGSPIGDYRDGAGAWAPMPLGDPGSISDGTLLTALETWLSRNPDKQIKVDKRITKRGPVFTASIEPAPWTLQKEE